FQAEDGIRDYKVTGVQTCALPISSSFLVAAISSLGVLGATCYALFLLSIWFQAREPEPEHITHIQSAARSACLAWLIAASTSGEIGRASCRERGEMSGWPRSVDAM